MTRLRDLAYYANLEGTSIDNIMNLKMKTPDKWMEKWEKNLIINPKFLSTVTDFDENREPSGREVTQMIASIKTSLKKEQAAKKKAYDKMQASPPTKSKMEK